MILAQCISSIKSYLQVIIASVASECISPAAAPISNVERVHKTYFAYSLMFF